MNKIFDATRPRQDAAATLRLCGDLMLAADEKNVSEMSSRQRSHGGILTDIVIVQFGSSDHKHPV